MKVNFSALIICLMLISCSEPNKQQQEESATVLEPEAAKLKEAEIDIPSIKNLIINSDSIHLLIGETSPHKIPLHLKERLTKKDDIKRLATFIPKDTTTSLIVYPIDTAKGELPPPPPIRWGRPIGAFVIFNDATDAEYIHFVIDSLDTFIYINNGRRRMAFTKEGDAYLRKMYNEYRSL